MLTALSDLSDYPGAINSQNPAEQLTFAPSVDEFLSNNPQSTWVTGNPTLHVPELKDYLTKYQNPHQANSILKIQMELDETKITLHKTIESVLQRGEKIDDLVAKSDGLSAQSKMFYRMFVSFPLTPDSSRIPNLVDTSERASFGCTRANRC